MIKPLSVIATMLVCCGPAAAAKSGGSGRSFEECNRIAVARGLRHGKTPERYTMLKGFGHKTNPQGMIARCMAGKLP